MSRTLYLYDGPAARAALHLLNHSELRGVTEQTPEYWWADAEAVKVDLVTPAPSRGERALWDAATAMSYEDGVIPTGAAAEFLDADNLRVLHESIGLLFQIDADVVLQPGAQP